MQFILTEYIEQAMAHAALGILATTGDERRRHAELGRDMLAAAGVDPQVEPLLAPPDDEAHT